MAPSLQRIDPKRKGDPRFYQLPNGRRLVSVTSILDLIAKPALITWAANQERELVTSVAVDTYRDCLSFPDRLSTVAFAATLASRIPKQRQFAKTANAAANIGVRVHKHIEDYLLRKVGETVPYPPPMQEAQKATDAFDEWAERVNLEPVVIEAQVYNESVGYAGTLDAVVELDHEGRRIRCVADWKTSTGIYDEYLLQLAAYANAEYAANITASNPKLVSSDETTSSMYGLIVRFDKKKVGVVEHLFIPPHRMADNFEAFKGIKSAWDWFHRAKETPLAPTT